MRFPSGENATEELPYIIRCDREDYPGIRHGSDSKGVLRAVDMRDMVAMCILLAGFTPYLIQKMDGESVYRGLLK